MLGRGAALAVVMLAAACANVQSAGRNAERAPVQQARVEAPPAAAPAPQPSVPVAPPQQAAPPVAAANVAAPPAPPPPRRDADDDEIVVPGGVEQQVPAPAGDPRTAAQRMADIRRWDQCVTRVQARAEADPMRPQLEMPEDYCSEALGMTDRLAVPDSRR